MNISLRFGAFTRATIAGATFWSLLATVVLLPASCEGQDAEGIQRLLLRLQQMDVEHNGGPCTTASKFSSSAAVETGSGSSRVKSPRRLSEADVPPPPALARNGVDQSQQVYGVLAPVVRPEVFGPEPYMATPVGGSRNGFEQEPDSYSSPTPVNLVSSSTSTRPLTVSKAASLWKSYCNNDDLAPTTSGIEQGCPCRGN